MGKNCAGDVQAAVDIWYPAQQYLPQETWLRFLFDESKKVVVPGMLKER